jgi:O-antigen ligase
MRGRVLIGFRRLPTSSSLVGLVAAATLAGLGFRNGGFSPAMWSWASLGLAWVAFVTLIIRSPLRPSSLEALTLGSLACLAGWTQVTAMWSVDASQSVREAERALLYAIGVAAVLVLAVRRPVAQLLGGVLVGITTVACYALLRYLFESGRRLPDPFEGYLLFRPVGYANALGVLAAIGILLALGFVVHEDQRGLRTVSAAALVPLVSTLALTSSRASWLALVAGLGAMLALERQRLRTVGAMVVVSPGLAAAVWLIRRAHLSSVPPLFNTGRAQHLGIAILLLTAGTAVSAQVGLAAAGRFQLGRRLALAAGGIAVMAVLAVGVLAANSENSYAPSNRSAYWHVAWAEWKDHRILGSGAGTFGHYWQQKGTGSGAQDAHNLYLESLAELGPVGAALLVAGLGLPVIAAIKARRHRLVPTAFGAYVVYLLHAGLDWDWEMPVVTLAALFCGAALLIAARGPMSASVTGQTRTLSLAATVAIVALSCAELVANGAITL